MPDPSKAWIAKAEDDEAVARLIEAAGSPLSLAGYHLQQAAEKRIKARLIQSGIKPAKIHDLVSLADEIAGEKSDELWESLRNLSILAWVTRYPGYEELDEAQYKELADDYRRVVNWLQGLS